MTIPELTEVGRAYALRIEETSVVARVALHNYDDWPLTYVRVARLLMNAEGDGTKLSDEERTIIVGST